MPWRDDVAVSVRTPPKLAVFASGEKLGVSLCESRELAGRATRRAERANTIFDEWRVTDGGKESSFPRPKKITGPYVAFGWFLARKGT